MKNIDSKVVYILLLMLFLHNNALATQKSDPVLTAKHLRVEGIKDPLGLQNVHPRFSWKSISTARGTVQSAYQIMVASSVEKLIKNEADIWNSKKVLSSEQHHVSYKGPKLNPGNKYYWKVKIWDGNGIGSPWSEIASWAMGPLNAADWKAEWISFDTAEAKAQPLFRKQFSLDKKIKRATVYISGLGYYELYLNGRKVGDHVLDPAQTNYEHYALYATYDVTEQLQKGENAVGVMLGDGWYNQNVVWRPGGFSYGNPLLLCQLDVEYADGTKSQIVSDKSWQWTDGPVIRSNVYAGEVYDARKEISGWSSAGKPAGNWRQVLIPDDHPPALRPQELPPIKKMKELPVKNLYKTEDGKYIFDFGQNFAGWTRLRIKAPAGTHLKIRTAEEVDSLGKLDPKSTGVFATKVVQTEEYITKGKGTEIWEPRFTYHGFRYAEVSGLPYKPEPNLLTGVVVYSSVEDAGTFSCSEEQFNRLHEMAKWTLTSNLHGIPTDCPTREKCGWLGDAHAIAPMSIYNFDTESFWEKYLHDIHSTSKPSVKTIFHVSKNSVFREGVKPAGIPFMVAPGKRLPGVASVDWGTAYVQLPWYLYLHYGNKDILKEFYPDMKQWVEYSQTLTTDNIIYEGLGDWCPPGGNKTMECPVELSSTAFHYLDLSIMAQVADLLDKQEDGRQFKHLQEQVKEAFIDQFFDKEGNTYGSQTANVMALDFGLIPNGKAKAVADATAKNIEQQHDGFMHAGIFGLQRLFSMLSRYGNEAAAYDIMSKKGNNSFETMWESYNATTLWEILPINTLTDNSNNGSLNHPMQGGFDQWFFEGILGIRPDAKSGGYKKIILDPELTQQLKWAEGAYQSPYGLIRSEWSNTGNTFEWHVSVPANTTARLYIPATSAEVIKEGGVDIKEKPEIKFLKMEGNKAVLDIGSSTYRFASIQNK
jgi:alpha-L-rhamnosidase